MEINEGYKITGAGVIPEDWHIDHIGNVCEIYGRIGFRGYTKKDIVQKGNGAITLSPSNIIDGQLNISRCTYISWLKYEESPEIKIYNGDILLVKTGSTYGKTALVRHLNEKATVNPQIVVLKKIKVDNVYLSYVMGFKTIQGQINSFIVGGAIPTLSQKQVAGFLAPFPSSSAEQNAIATALSDMDALIAQTEKLIEKKKAIKQGMMQQLLSPYDVEGKLKDGWMKIKIGDYGKTYGGLTGKSKKDFGSGTSRYIPFMNIMSNPIIDIDYFDMVSVRTGESQNKAQYKDLFFNGSSETPEEVGMCSILLDRVDDLYLNSFCFGFRLNSPDIINGLFLTYYFRSSYGRQIIFSLAQGATRYNLSKANFLNLTFFIPNRKEQDSIATVIRNLDEDLDKLILKVAKLQNLKQAMMQSLLTGKIRIYKPKHASTTKV